MQPVVWAKLDGEIRDSFWKKDERLIRAEDRVGSSARGLPDGRDRDERGKCA
ncbi:MAG: hypothetical protein U0V48_18010 [Anaerolineales bacterium]